MVGVAVVMFGSGGVGKSAMTWRYCHDEFLEDYDPTIEDTYAKEAEIQGTKITVDIRDTAGQEEFVSLREQYIRTGNGFILVYSVNDAESFREAKSIEQKILRVKDKAKGEVPIMLCGNKADLPLESHVVDEEEVKKYCEENSALYYKCSAKTNDNIEEAFSDLIAHTVEICDLKNKKKRFSFFGKSKKKK